MQIPFCRTRPDQLCNDGLMPTLAAVCSLTILGYGGNLVLSGELPVGDFVAFFMFVNMVVQPFRVAGFIVNLYQRAGVASTRLFEVFDREPEIADSPKTDAPAHISGAIRVSDLSYRYPGRKATRTGPRQLDAQSRRDHSDYGPSGRWQNHIAKANCATDRSCASTHFHRRCRSRRLSVITTALSGSPGPTRSILVRRTP